MRRLRAFCASGEHVFWPDSISLRNERIFVSELPVTQRQLTDVYLLGLAVRQGGRVATSDRRTPLGTVVGAGPDDLALVPV